MPSPAMAKPTATPTQPARVLGPIDATSVVIGAIIGVGIFFNPAQVARLVESGPLVLLVWGIAGAIALCGALTFAELGVRYHASGAQYEILRDTYGPMPSFLFVFCNATAIQTGAIGVIAVICAENLGVAAGGSPPTGAPLLALAGLLVLGVTAANIVGVRWGARIQNFTVLAKLLTLLTVTALGMMLGTNSVDAPAVAGAEAPARSAFGAVLSALVPALFAYGGWQHALWISGEVRDPKRNLPRAIVGGVLIVIVMYVLANWAYLRLLGPAGVAASKTLAADAVATVWPQTGRRIIAGAVALSAFGVLNAQLLSGPRLLFGMARDGRFFRRFGELSPRFGTPVAAILLLSLGALALLYIVRDKDVVDRLTTGVVFVDTVFFALTGVGLFILRHRGTPDAERTFRVPGYPVVPALFVIGELGLLVGALLNPEARVPALIGAAWIAAGFVLYMLKFRLQRPRSA